jgi:hypothetical protein
MAITLLRGMGGGAAFSLLCYNRFMSEPDRPTSNSGSLPAPSQEVINARAADPAPRLPSPAASGLAGQAAEDEIELPIRIDADNLPSGESGQDIDDLDLLAMALVGAVLEAPDEMMRRLRIYRRALRQLNDEQLSELLRENGVEETEADRLRYALVGLALEAPGMARHGLGLALKLGDRAARSVGRFLGPVSNSRVMRPARQRFDRALNRGETIYNRWVDAGRIEEPVSRRLVRTSVTGSVDRFISDLTTNEEVQELVQGQSMGAVGQVIFEVRRTSLSIDDVVHSLADGPTRARTLASIRAMLSKSLFRKEVPEEPEPDDRS